MKASEYLQKTLSENMIQNQICEELEAKRYFFWRQNTSPIYDKSIGTFRRMSRFAKKGVPDIIVVIRGKFVGLEVKKHNGVQSKEQKDFEIECKKNNGYYRIVKSVEDAIQFLESIKQYENRNL